jgi:hypothetical protein
MIAISGAENIAIRLVPVRSVSYALIPLVKGHCEV